MSNSCNKNPTPSNNTETVKNERHIKLSPLLLNRFECRIE